LPDVEDASVGSHGVVMPPLPLVPRASGEVAYVTQNRSHSGPVAPQLESAERRELHTPRAPEGGRSPKVPIRPGCGRLATPGVMGKRRPVFPGW
jgi:hypothetical protein